MIVGWKTCLRVGISIFVLYLCISYLGFVQNTLSMLFNAVLPLLVGCAIAYLINIPMSFYEKIYFPNTKNKLLNKSRRPVCMLLAFLSFTLIIAFIIGLILPQFISCVQVIIAKIPDAMQYTLAAVKKIDMIPDSLINTLSGIDWNSQIGDIISTLTSGIGSVMDIALTTIMSVFSGIVTTIVSIIFAIYILSSKNKLKNQITKLMKRYLKENVCAKINHFLSVLNDCFHNYIVGQCTEAVIIGALCTLGMMILRLPYATMIGALVAFTALIPVAGAYIGAIVGAFIIVTISPVKALIFLVFIVILQHIEGNLIYPKVVGSSIGLPGIWVLAAVTIGGGVFGVVGMLLAVPIAACIYKLIGEDVNKNIL